MFSEKRSGCVMNNLRQLVLNFTGNFHRYHYLLMIKLWKNEF